jgi:c-di-GMP-binding flagellar brake protein YcgR
MDIAKYLIKTPKQVLMHLKLLSTDKCLISASFGEDEKDTFITTILEINEKKQTLIIDCGPKEYLNKKLLNSAIIKLKTDYKGITVQFEGRKIKKAITNNGQPAFITPIPRSMYWVQRRQFHRVKSPLSKNSYCSVILIDPETEKELTVKLKLYNLSGTGFSVINELNSFSSQLLPSTTFENCMLVLENEQSQRISFEIRNNIPINPHRPKTGNRIGCQITAGSANTESAIFRYILNIERELKNTVLTRI